MTQQEDTADLAAAGQIGPVTPRTFRIAPFVGLLSVATGLAIWELISRFVVANSLFLAAPSQTAYALYQLAITGELAHHTYVSGLEFLIGYVIASFLGILLGMLMDGV